MKRDRKMILFMMVFLMTVLFMQTSVSAKRVMRHPSQISIHDLFAETQKDSPDPNKMSFVFWFPTQTWEAMFHQDPSMSLADIQEGMAIMEDYILVMVLDGKFGPLGGVTYTSEQDVRYNLRMIDVNGVEHRPLADSEVGADVRIFANMIKMIIAENLGSMGDNLNIFFFISKSVDASSDGDFHIRVGDELYSWRFPLATLLETSTCPICGSQWPGNYNFCPWEGTPL